jgi:hypothetical protein
MSRHTRVRVVAGSAALLAGLGALTACGDDGTTVAAGDGGTVKVDKDKLTVESSEGTATIGKDLPDGFPIDDIPLVDESVVAGTKGTAGGPFAWSVVMQSSRSVDDLSAEVQKDYASWKSDKGTGTSLGDVSILHFVDSAYEVGVTIARTGGNVTITYVVKDAG